LKQLKPLVVGHFDLIRLKSDDMERSFTTWPGVWLSSPLVHRSVIVNWYRVHVVNRANEEFEGEP
jgi:hypothetical protein